MYTGGATIQVRRLPKLVQILAVRCTQQASVASMFVRLWRLPPIN